MASVTTGSATVTTDSDMDDLTDTEVNTVWDTGNTAWDSETTDLDTADTTAMDTDPTTGDITTERRAITRQ